ncbi:hypothetical protein AB4Z18_08215 [Leifsonia sp. 2TAF2]|uniref:hypothetical protein n=1 Tax=Leifsonia sp. 2TAF2 TaxID=3233009 RepID=UPI003F9DF010
MPTLGRLAGRGEDRLLHDALRRHPEVRFEVDDVVSVDERRSVIAWGTFEQLLGAEAWEGLDVLLDRLRPARESAGTAHRELKSGYVVPGTDDTI